MKIEFRRSRTADAISMKIDGKFSCGVATEPYFKDEYKSMRDSNIRVITSIIRKELIKKYWREETKQ